MLLFELHAIRYSILTIVLKETLKTGAPSFSRRNIFINPNESHGAIQEFSFELTKVT